MPPFSLAVPMLRTSIARAFARPWFARITRPKFRPLVRAEFACGDLLGEALFLFEWPHHERTLWTDFTALKAAARLEFPGAFHRLRFGFANANVDALPADLLQKLMRHQSPATTRRYINAAERMKRTGTAAKLHVPAALKVATAR
jgi:integrase